VEGGKFVLVFVNNRSKNIVLVRKFKEIMLDIRNFFAIKEAKKRAKDGTGSGSGNKNLPFMTVMFDGDGAGGVDRDVVRNVVEMEVSGAGRRRSGGWRRSDRDEVRSGQVSERVVEEVGDVGVTGSEVGGEVVNVGITVTELAGKVFAIKFTRDNISDFNSMAQLTRLARSNKRKARNCMSF
jgi:hypothetical protein